MIIKMIRMKNIQLIKLKLNLNVKIIQKINKEIKKTTIFLIFQNKISAKIK